MKQVLPRLTRPTIPVSCSSGVGGRGRRRGGGEGESGHFPVLHPIPDTHYSGNQYYRHVQLFQDGWWLNMLTEYGGGSIC